MKRNQTIISVFIKRISLQNEVPTPIPPEPNTRGTKNKALEGTLSYDPSYLQKEQRPKDHTLSLVVAPRSVSALSPSTGSMPFAHASVD